MRLTAVLLAATLLALVPAPADAKSDWPCAACKVVL